MTTAADDHADFSALAAACTDGGCDAMLEALAGSLARRGRWHAVFDVRMVQARRQLGLPLAGDVGPLDDAARDRLDRLSLAACREVGWPLLDAGQVAAGWMYLRAAAAADELTPRLAALADRAAGGGDRPVADDAADDLERLRQEILGVTLWESADPELGISLVLRTQGTCNAITCYEQAVSRLTAVRQEPAAWLLVEHLHAEVVRNLAADLEQRGVDTAAALAAETPLVALLAVAGRDEDGGIHVDVSHLQSILRIARICSDPIALRRAWELASYACRLPAEVVYPGEPPFENVGESSRLFFGAQVGSESQAEAVGHFRRAAAMAEPIEAGTLPLDVLVLLLHRLGRDAEALQAAVAQPRETTAPSQLQAAGVLPPLVALAAASGEWNTLLDACRRQGDEITFAVALAAREAAQNQDSGQSQRQQ